MKHSLLTLFALALTLPCMAATPSMRTYTYSDTITLDLYTPQQPAPEQGYPVFIYTHGGGFNVGDKTIDVSNPSSAFTQMLQAGIAIASIDYRHGMRIARESGELGLDKVMLSDQDLAGVKVAQAMERSVRWAVEDQMRASAYLYKHANELQLDTARFISGGGSAGAITSLQAEYELCNHTETARANLPEGFRYAGVVCGAGGIFLKGENALPQWKSAPCPILMFHGTADPAVGFSRRYMEAIDYSQVGPAVITESLKANKYPYWLYVGKDYDHVISGTPFENQGYEILGFIQRMVDEKATVFIETVEEDYTGPNNLVRYFAKKLGVPEDAVKALMLKKATE